jgi:hypothetical protein
MMVRRVVALVSAVVAVPIIVAVPAQSIPACKAGYQCTRTYYTDQTHDVAVGGSTRFCDGTIDEWGTTTRYQVTTQAQCPPDM